RQPGGYLSCSHHGSADLFLEGIRTRKRLVASRTYSCRWGDDEGVDRPAALSVVHFLSRHAQGQSSVQETRALRRPCDGGHRSPRDVSIDAAFSDRDASPEKHVAGDQYRIQYRGVGVLSDAAKSTRSPSRHVGLSVYVLARGLGDTQRGNRFLLCFDLHLCAVPAAHFLFLPD